MNTIIHPNEVHLWQANLASPEIADAPRLNVLDHTEQRRADRFRFAADRQRFIKRHIFLRTVLAQYLDTTPADIEFETTPLGKPYLAGFSPQDGITFNLSHSGEDVAIAIGRDRPVGVDIERTDREVDGLVIARQFFSRHQSDWLAELPAAQRGAAFLHCWTAREALLKATGHGLTVPLNHLDFATERERATRISHPPAGCDAPVEWLIVHGTTAALVLIAVAARGADWTLHLQDPSGASSKSLSCSSANENEEE